MKLRYFNTEPEESPFTSHFSLSSILIVFFKMYQSISKTIDIPMHGMLDTVQYLRAYSGSQARTNEHYKHPLSLYCQLSWSIHENFAPHIIIWRQQYEFSSLFPFSHEFGVNMFLFHAFHRRVTLADETSFMFKYVFAISAGSTRKNWLSGFHDITYWPFPQRALYPVVIAVHNCAQFKQ